MIAEILDQVVIMVLGTLGLAQVLRALNCRSSQGEQGGGRSPFLVRILSSLIDNGLG